MGRRPTEHRMYKKGKPMDMRYMQAKIKTLTRFGIKYEIRECMDADHEPAYKLIWDRDRYLIAIGELIV